MIGSKTINFMPCKTHLNAQRFGIKQEVLIQILQKGRERDVNLHSDLSLCSLGGFFGKVMSLKALIKWNDYF